MTHRTAIIMLIMFSPLFFCQDKDTDKKPNTFVGAETCGLCHKTEKAGKQYDIWKSTKHSQAYKALLTPRADSIALARGYKTPAIKTDECMGCHTSGYKADPTLLGAKFHVEDGVQCETCHGAGSNYKSVSIMKNKEEAIKNGLMIHTDRESFCVQCHNEKSPTYVKQDFAVMWDKIKHPIPKSK
ncbi:MAG: cytochrome c family protein [Ignavibacteriaceae bacterium]|nr:cytochrome c family protein [Ignavibacteriaceae bacterium]